MRKQREVWEAKLRAALLAHQETLPNELILARTEERRREAKRSSNRRCARRKRIHAWMAQYLKYSRAAEAEVYESASKIARAAVSASQKLERASQIEV